MTTRARLQNANDSKSLWNFTLSPGWSGFDAHILRLALMRYGCGGWRQISKHFPMKTCGQLNLQTQRLFGQQALAEFQKVHIDPNNIKVVNDKIDGFRKNTCLINTGNNVSAQEANRRRQEHTAKHGIPEDLYKQITVPVVLDAPKDLDGLVDDIEKLREMYRCVYDIELRLRHLKTNPNDTGVKVTVKSAPKTTKPTDSKNTTQSKEVAQEATKEDATDSKEMETETAKENDNPNSMEVSNTPEKAQPESVVEDTGAAMDDDMAIAMALSASMANANIKTPAVERAKTKTKKKSTKKSSKKKKSAKKSAKKSSKKKSAKKSSKKKLGKKRKKCPDDGEGDDALPDEPTKKVKH